MLEKAAVVLLEVQVPSSLYEHPVSLAKPFSYKQTEDGAPALCEVSHVQTTECNGRMNNHSRGFRFGYRWWVGDEWRGFFALKNDV